MAKNKMMCTSNGMLRMYSMNTLATLETIQLLDRRATPTKMPSSVATKMPAIESRSVFTAPAHSARPPVSGSLSMVPVRLMPGSTSRKS